MRARTGCQEARALRNHSSALGDALRRLGLQAVLISLVLGEPRVAGAARRRWRTTRPLRHALEPERARSRVSSRLRASMARRSSAKPFKVAHPLPRRDSLELRCTDNDGPSSTRTCSRPDRFFTHCCRLRLADQVRCVGHERAPAGAAFRVCCDRCAMSVRNYGHRVSVASDSESDSPRRLSRQSPRLHLAEPCVPPRGLRGRPPVMCTPPASWTPGSSLRSSPKTSSSRLTAPA